VSVRPPVVVPAATLAAIPLLALALRLLAGPAVQESPAAAVTQAAPRPAPADTSRPAGPTPAAAPDSAAAALTRPADADGLTYEREFFWYEGAGRRDPFQPLLDLDLRDEGPRFDTLVLTGIFVGDGGPGMVVVEDEQRKGYFLKPGDRVGRASLVEIRSDHAVFDVHDFGVSRRDTLRLQRPEDPR
jgi:hypothetical protein